MLQSLHFDTIQLTSLIESFGKATNANKANVPFGTIGKRPKDHKGLKDKSSHLVLTILVRNSIDEKPKYFQRCIDIKNDSNTTKSFVSGLAIDDLKMTEY